MNYIHSISLKEFTAFEELDIDFNSGLNIFIGKNSTGKTHLMKLLYSSVSITGKKSGDLASKIINVFLPSERKIGKLVTRRSGMNNCKVEIIRKADGDNGNTKLEFGFSAKFSDSSSNDLKIKGIEKWIKQESIAAYIPVKEMLANAVGFSSLYNERLIHFEEIYFDILQKAYLAQTKGSESQEQKRLLKSLEGSFEGKVSVKNEEFFLRNKSGNLEFSLLAEGYRKLALLWLLIKNKTLTKGSILFWDEPETNLNPKVIGSLAEILLQLQRMGVQIFIASHDYVLLKEIDLAKKKNDKLTYFSFYTESGKRDKKEKVKVKKTDDINDLSDSAISQTFNDLLRRQIEKSMKGKE